MNELIKVSQLPVIEERLRSLKGDIDKAVSEAKSLACTPDTVASVRKVRSDLHKQYEELEKQRISVKNAIMQPYLSLEAVYKECVSAPYKEADADLAKKISDTEKSIKDSCEEGLKDYFSELCEAEGVQWLTYDRAGIVVDMASARQKSPKKLREKITQFVTGVSRGVSLIAEMDNADEIMVEFKRTLHAAEAISIVHERHRRVAEEKEALSETPHSSFAPAQSTVPPMPEVSTPRDESFSPPKVIQAQEESASDDGSPVVYVSFKVTGTIQKIKELKKFLVDGGYEYEQLRE